MINNKSNCIIPGIIEIICYYIDDMSIIRLGTSSKFLKKYIFNNIIIDVEIISVGQGIKYMNCFNKVKFTFSYDEMCDNFNFSELNDIYNLRLNPDCDVFDNHIENLTKLEKLSSVGNHTISNN